MKAIRVTEPGTLEIVEVEKPALQSEEEVLVKVTAAGICGSDMHIYHGSNPFTVYPRVIGHEVTGIVEETGSEVTGLQKGDQVVLEPIESCGICYACRKGRPNICRKLEVYGVHREGGMREFVTAPQKNWHKIDDSIKPEQAVLAEPLTIGAQATSRGKVEQGDTVLIIGAGPTGLSCLQIAKAKGAVVLISDYNQERLNYAKSIGADYIINPGNEPLEERVKEITKEELANVVIDAVGTARTIEQAVSLASEAGRVVNLGFTDAVSSFTSLSITKKEIELVGSRLQANKFPEIIKQLNNHELDADSLVSHTFNFTDVHEAFRLLQDDPEAVRKAVLLFP